MFDVKPLNENGVVEIHLDPVINTRLALVKQVRQEPALYLRNQKPADSAYSSQAGNAGIWGNGESQSRTQKLILDSKVSIANPYLVSSDNMDSLISIPWTPEESNPIDSSVENKLVSDRAHGFSRLSVLKNLSNELAALLDNDLDYQAELVSVGAQVHGEPKISKPRYKPILKKRNIIQDIYEKILLEINQGRFRPSFYPEAEFSTGGSISQARESLTSTAWKSNFHASKIILIVLTIAVFIFGIWKLGIKFKNNIVESGNSAVSNLQTAETNLGGFEIAKALANFSNAYDDFSKTGDNLNFMGNYLSGLIAEIPGNDTYKSARNLIEAGKLFSRAGESIANALNSISKAGVILNPNDSGASLVSNLKKAVLLSQADIHKAAILLTNIDLAIIPEENKDAFTEFQAKMSGILDMVDEGAEYTRFLENLIAINTSKKYLMLFQNPSELRPTGGFLGSYGILHFKNGKIEEFKVDDVYNLDGQLRENIIPPKELQHITPTWGMRDANWFIDFPTSARKIMEFFNKEAGYSVDGVITFSPVIVGKILDITGPIELPEYNLTLDSKNFIQKIQAEVEYGSNRTQPKTILSNFAPKLLEKIYSAAPADWMKIFDILIKSPENRDMILYFKELSLQSFVMENGFGGDIKNVDGDYVMPTISNIKGSKTDLVTYNFIKLYTSFNGGYAKHKLIITRKHNGGTEKYGFYNRPNPAYLRILVPESAEFIGINSNDKPNYKPLIGYNNPEFSSDSDLSLFEALKTKNEADVTESYESGKKSYGFWLIIKSGETKSVELSYQVPIKDARSYSIYIQKQPGLNINDFEIVFDDSIHIVSGQQTGKMETDTIIKAVLQ